jgi:hypothetical protein
MNMMGFYLFSICVNALSLVSSVFVIYALSLLAVFLGFGFMGVDSIGFKLVGVDLFRALVYTFYALPWFAIIFRFIKRKWFSSRIRPLYRILLILFLIHFVQPISAMDIGMESEAFTLTGSAVVSSLAVHTFPERFHLTPIPREVLAPTYTILPSRPENYNHEEDEEDEGEVSNPDGCLCPPCSESSESDSDCSDGSPRMNACSLRHESESDEADDQWCPPCEENVLGQDDEDENDEASAEMSLPCQDSQFECWDSDGSLYMNEWNSIGWSPCEDFEESDEANFEMCPPCAEDVEENVGDDESEAKEHDQSVEDGEFEVTLLSIDMSL